MNYNKLYSRFIESIPLRSKQYNDGLEKHHILPKSIGGKNDKKNLIVLTPREHFIAHRMLAKMFKGQKKMKMSFALLALGHYRNKRRDNDKLNSRQYNLAQKQWSEYLQTTEGKKWNSQRVKKQWTPKRRARQSEYMKKKWKTGAQDYLRSAEYRERKREQSKLIWKDPKYRKLQTQIQTLKWAKRKRLLNNQNQYKIT
jgi:hypothetical protein